MDLWGSKQRLLILPVLPALPCGWFELISPAWTAVRAHTNQAAKTLRAMPGLLPSLSNVRMLRGKSLLRCH